MAIPYLIALVVWYCLKMLVNCHRKNTNALLICMYRTRYTTGSGTGTGTDVEDSGTSNPQLALGCGTMFEYVVLVTACSILLLAVTGTTIYWTMAYRGGYDMNWFPWPPLTLRQMLSSGVFTYKHPQNFTTGGSDISTTITTTTVEQQQSSQLNISSSNGSIEDRRLNLHPTLMTIGFVTLTGFCKLLETYKHHILIK